MRKICVITGSRSEYGLLKNLIHSINKSKKLHLQLIVTGSHLSSDFGLTVKQIINDKFKINKRIKILENKDNTANLSKAMAAGLSKFSNTYKLLKPNLILILGDRYEILSAAISALFHKIPIAHLHGGERSEGAYDESIRHAITKFSHLHFVSTISHKNRVIQLGENKKNVHFTGSIGVENIKKIKFYSKKYLEDKFKIKFKKNNLFIIFHPATLEDNTQKKDMIEILKAASYFSNFGKFFVYPSADLGGKSIIKLINKYVKNNEFSYKFKSLDQKDYFSLVKNCNVVVGNSSSGIIEIPSLRVGVVNIGDRQRGRVKSEAIIDCKPSSKDIIQSIIKCMNKKNQEKIYKIKNPYDHKGTSKKIIEIIENKNSLENLIKKKFFDIK
ncbi:UDP-N-acetylglucosamine 2-epimerase [Candidatus Pelagibacter sp.]|jgi:GDP/UDP-N,N'-diacetylbacillosamine 2-epimerase (hydrolysing)|nr:UDP-N-acetylglucosamine 2-epimerase [Candidatus Pelagibacter sp.]